MSEGRRFIFGLVLAVAWPVTFAQAASGQVATGQAATPLEVASRIEAVTVFPDRAEVTRVVEITLPAGAARLVLPNLPADVLPNSLRAQGRGNFVLGSVESREDFGPVKGDDAVALLTEELEVLADQRRTLEDRIETARLQLSFVESLGREAPLTTKQSIEGQTMDPETWKQAWVLLGQGASEAREQIQKAEIEIRALDRESERLHRQLNQIRSNTTTSLMAQVNLEMTEAGPLRLAVTYQVPSASWRPVYDARLDSEAGSLDLAQYASVQQRSGEDWSGVALTLSTARPAQSAQLPDLGPWFVDFWAQHTGRGLSSELALIDRMEDSKRSQDKKKEDFEAEERDLLAPNAPVPLDPAQEQAAALRAYEFSSLYHVKGLVDVSANSSAHRFLIGEEALTPKLSLRVVPKVTPQAYLLAEVAYDGETPLLPGPLAVFRDGAFVGNAALELTLPGETRKLSFGVDDKVRVEHRLIKDERSTKGILARDRSFERRYLTEITNFHNQAMPVTLLDQLPVPKDELIEVVWLSDGTKPSIVDYEKRPGVLAWDAVIEPSASHKVDFGYAIRFPENREVSGF